MINNYTSNISGMYNNKYPQEETQFYNNKKLEANSFLEDQLMAGAAGEPSRYMSSASAEPKKFNTYNEEKLNKLTDMVSKTMLNEDKIPYFSVDADKESIVLPYTLNGALSINAKLIDTETYEITPVFDSKQNQTKTANLFIKGYIVGAEFVVTVPELPEGVTLGGVQSFLSSYSMRFTTDDSDFTVEDKLWSALTFGLRDKRFESTLREEQGISGIFDGALDASYNDGERQIKVNLPMSFRMTGILGLDSLGNGIASISSAQVATMKFNFKRLSEIYITDLPTTTFNPLDYQPKVELRIIYHNKPTQWLTELIQQQSGIIQDSQAAFVPLSTSASKTMSPLTDVSFETNFTTFSQKLIKMLIVSTQLQENEKFGPNYPKVPVRECSITDSSTAYFEYKDDANKELAKLLRDYDKFDNIIDNTYSVFIFALDTDFDKFSGCIVGNGSTKLLSTYDGKYNNDTVATTITQVVFALIYGLLTIKLDDKGIIPSYYLFF